MPMLTAPVAGDTTLDHRGLYRHRPQRTLPDGLKTVPALVAHCTATFGPAEALVGRWRRLSYRDVEAAADRVAAGLSALGVQPGDRVAASLPNHPELVVAFLAVLRLGAVWVGINRSLAPPEQVHLLRATGSALFLTDPGTTGRIRPSDIPVGCGILDVDVSASEPWAALPPAEIGLPDPSTIDPLAPAAIAFTSGTTGQPKGVVHSQHNLLTVGAVLAGNRPTPDRTGICLPLTILNLQVLGPLTVFRTGGCAVTMDRIDAAGVAEWIRRERITVLAAVPTVVHDLMTDPAISPDDLASLRSLGVGGTCSPTVERHYRERFGRPVTTVYGLTEAPTIVTMPAGTDPVPGSSGRALPHLLVDIVGPNGQPLPPDEIGEIRVGPATTGPYAGVWTPMLGYWEDPDATRRAVRAGHLHTGDVGHLDATGHLFVRGRRDAMIRRGGAIVAPAEIERVLLADPTVAGCIVFGVADERLGQRIVAAVEPAAGQTVDLDALRTHMAANLARTKIPADIHVLDRLPRNHMDRVVEREVRRMIGLAEAPAATTSDEEES